MSVHLIPADRTYIFRHENYGGLVQARQDGRRWDVTHPDALFFSLLRRTGDTGSAAAIVRRALPGTPYVPDVTGFEEAGVIVASEQAFAPVDTEALVRWAQEQYAESQTRQWLRAPSNLSIYPIMKCKGKCEICFIRPGMWLPGMAPAEQWIQVMQDAHAMGVPFLSFLGGDSSHYPGIHELVRACDVIGIKSTLTTIGLYMPDTLFSALVDSQWVTPTISLQSLDEYHRKITGWSAEPSIATLQRLSDAGKQCRVNLVWTEQSFEQIIEVLELCLEVGALKMSVGVFFNVNNVKVTAPSFEQYRTMYERVKAWLAEHHPGKIEFTVEGCQLYTAYPDLTRLPDPGYETYVTGCEAGNGRGEIMNDGMLLGCAFLDRDRWTDLNVFEVGLRLAWDESEALQRLRTYHNQDTACGACQFGGFCNGGCPAINENYYGPGQIVQGGDPRCQIRRGIIEELGIKPPGVRLLPLLTTPAVRKGRPQRPISGSSTSG